MTPSPLLTFLVLLTSTCWKWIAELRLQLFPVIFHVSEHSSYVDHLC